MRTTYPAFVALIFVAALIGMAPPAPLGAVETEVTVRVLSRDAKFVGTSMGGARVTIRDAATGELLAQGVTRGSTGSTERLMRSPRARDAEISSPGSAAWETSLDLERPTLLEITAHGPLAQLQSAVSASTTRWVVPGKGLAGGDGVVLELAGFAVDLLAPPAHVRMPLTGERAGEGDPDQGLEVELLINLVML